MDQCKHFRCAKQIGIILTFLISTISTNAYSKIFYSKTVAFIYDRPDTKSKILKTLPVGYKLQCTEDVSLEGFRLTNTEASFGYVLDSVLTITRPVPVASNNYQAASENTLDIPKTFLVITLSLVCICAGIYAHQMYKHNGHLYNKAYFMKAYTGLKNVLVNIQQPSIICNMAICGFLCYASTGHIVSHGFYTLLRVVIFTAGLIVATIYTRDKMYLLAFSMLLLALLFNPIFPVELHKTQWQEIDTWAYKVVGVFAVYEMVKRILRMLKDKKQLSE